MHLVSTISERMPSLDGPRNVIRDAWNRLSPLPGGSRLFSRMIALAAPYTGTIDAQIVELRPGYAKTALRDRRAVRNHLCSIHAVALANLVELTGNVALAYSLPDDARFIVAGMSLDYLKKARGPITGICECAVPETSARREYEIVVRLMDGAGDEVVRGTLRSLVGPKSAPGGRARA